jgi:hypothetical protein
MARFRPENAFSSCLCVAVFGVTFSLGRDYELYEPWDFGCLLLLFFSFFFFFFFFLRMQVDSKILKSVLL